MVKQQTRAYLYALTAIFFWSTAATAFKITLRHLDVNAMLFYSSLVSLICLGAVSLANGGFGRLRQLRSGDIRSSMLLGFFNPFLYYVLLFKAYSLIPAQQALTLNNIWPIMLVILSVPLLGQRLTFRSLPAFLFCFGGVMMIATGGKLSGFAFKSPLGVACALSSSTVWAFYWLYNVRDRRDDRDKLFLNFVFGTFYSGVLFYISGASVPTFTAFSGAAYIGLFEMGLAFLFWLRALSLTSDTARVSIIVYLTPIMSLIFLSLLTGERISTATVMGLFAIIIGIFIQNPPWRKVNAPD